MSTDQEQDPIDQIVFLLRIIHLVLASGVGMFLGIVLLVLRHGAFLGKDPWSLTMPITMIAVLFAFVAIVAHVAVPNLAVNARRRELARVKPAHDAANTDADAMIALYATQKIIGTAIIEGAAFCNTIAYFLEGTALPLLLTLLLLGVILTRVPSRAGMENWLGAQLTLLQEERRIE